MERNHISRGAKKALGELEHSLDTTEHHGGFSSGRNLQNEIQPLVRKDRLSDMTRNSGGMDKQS